MSVSTHWDGAGNVGDRGGQGVYCLPPQYGHAKNCNPSYHGLVSDSGAEAGTAPIQVMVGKSRSGYPGVKRGACSR